MSIGDGIFAAAIIWGFVRGINLLMGARAVQSVNNMESRVYEIERKLDENGIS